MIAFYLKAMLFLTCLVQDLAALKLCLKERVDEANQYEEENEVRRQTILCELRSFSSHFMFLCALSTYFSLCYESDYGSVWFHHQEEEGGSFISRLTNQNLHKICILSKGKMFCFCWTQSTGKVSTKTYFTT